MEKRKIALYLNGSIILFEVVALVFSILHHGVSLFLYYTQICNLFALVGSALYLVYRGRNTSPKWLRLVRYTNVVTLTITFLVVVIILAPLICMREVFANHESFGTGVWTSAKEMFLGGSVFFHHIICPILTFVSFVYFEEGEEISKRESLWALIPTIAYAGVLILLNILRVVEGPYPFLMVYQQGALLSCAWALVIFAMAYLLGALVWRILHKRA